MLVRNRCKWDRDVQILVCEHEPRRDVLPQWRVRGQAFREGCLRDRTLRRLADADNHAVDDADGVGGDEESLAASADEHGHEFGNVAG